MIEQARQLDAAVVDSRRLLLEHAMASSVAERIELQRHRLIDRRHPRIPEKITHPGKVPETVVMPSIATLILCMGSGTHFRPDSGQNRPSTKNDRFWYAPRDWLASPVTMLATERRLHQRCWWSLRE